MNIEAMGWMFVVLSSASIVALLGVVAIDKYRVHPFWVVGAIFVIGILAVGVMAK